MKWKEKRGTLVICGALAVLYLLSLCTLLVKSAYEIQDTMECETEELCTEAIGKIMNTSVQMDEQIPRSEQIFRYQKLMADNELGMSGSYAFRCVSAIGVPTKGEWDMPVYSRNMLLAEIKWTDGTVDCIPIVFPYENSADIAQLMLNSVIVGDEGFKAAGYWKDDLFHLQYLYTGSSFSYKSPVDAPEGAELESIHAVFARTPERVGGRSASNLDLTRALKYYGTSGITAPFVKQWEADDELIAEMQETGFSLEGVFGNEPTVRCSPLNRTIFKTKLLFRRIVKDNGNLGSQSGYMRVAYMVEFSSIALAWRVLWGSGIPLILLCLFVFAGLFLTSSYRYASTRERRSYQDEITRQTRALEYAKNAEASRREMTSAIAHELKTPIAVLSSYAEALQENIDAEKQEHYLSVIREETGKMDRMVLELLDLSRLEAGKYKLQREPFNLEELAREIIAPLTPQIEKKGLTLTWQVGETTVDADRYRLGQVVENFMTNAIRHTPEGGKIVLRIGMDRETFSVENQGKPIPTEQLPKVWETFWQGDSSRSERGSGLGLAICRTIVTLHGGSCKAENTNAGVKFSISLSAEQKLYQLGRLPQEETVNLTYPIARWYTTVERVMRRLELLSSQSLERELKAGNVYLGEDPVTAKRTKLYPGYVLSWQEFRITICRDDDEKRRAMLADRMFRGTLGYQDGMKTPGWVGRP